MNNSKILSMIWGKHIFDKYKEFIDYDQSLYLHWSKKAELERSDLKTIEWKYLICLRKAQATKGTLWERLYLRKLKKMTERTGIWIPANINCGKGIIIAHWGRILVNPATTIGDEFSVSSGAVIGRDIRGKRRGVPIIGNKVVIKTNAVIVGNITIGNDVLIAPNAYVNFDVPDHSIVIGNPGEIILKENATEGYI